MKIEELSDESRALLIEVMRERRSKVAESIEALRQQEAEITRWLVEHDKGSEQA